MQALFVQKAMRGVFEVTRFWMIFTITFSKAQMKSTRNRNRHLQRALVKVQGGDAAELPRSLEKASNLR